MMKADEEETGDTAPTLEERLALLEARAGITETLFQYAHAIDYGDEDAWVGCFTDDARWESHTVEGKWLHLSGRAELQRFIASHSRAPELYHKHLMATPLIRVAGDVASARCYFVLLVADRADMPTPAAFGRYLDELRRDADGTWRFTHRRAEVEAFNPLWSELRGPALTDLLQPGGSFGP
jgi:3-phenylpropionate/cinnamic acid dioxygenase small subunit